MTICSQLIVLQVTIGGQLILHNQLVTDIEVKLLSFTGTSKDVIIPLTAKTTGASSVLPLEKIQGLKIRPIGSKLPWSQETTLLEIDDDKAKLMKVNLYSFAFILTFFTNLHSFKVIFLYIKFIFIANLYLLQIYIYLHSNLYSFTSYYSFTFMLYLVCVKLVSSLC